MTPLSPHAELERLKASKPVAPPGSACCQSDCGSSCIFEVHARDLERWREAIDTLTAELASPDHRPPSLP